MVAARMRLKWFRFFGATDSRTTSRFESCTISLFLPRT